MEDQSDLRHVLLKGNKKPATGLTPWRLTMLGTGAAVVLLGIVLLLDAGSSGPNPERTADEEIVELVGPGRLDESETAGGGMLDPDIGLDLPAGGWVQIADSDGNLAQQYRCEHLDPNPSEYPAHWIDMVKPQVEMYLSDNRLLTITGDRAVAYAPSRALETGRITGNVRINLYEPVDGKIAQPSMHPPDMTMRTSRAEVDNFLGKILCDDRIDLNTKTESMVGHDLKVLLNSQADRIEYLTLAQLDYLLMQPEEDSVALQTDPTWPLRGDRTAPRLTRTTGDRSIRPVRGLAQPAPAATSDTIFYKMTLHENIRILQGDIRDGKVVTGDDLHLTFSMESDSFSADQARQGMPDHGPMARSLPWSHWLTWMTVAVNNVPVPGPKDILLTCDGGVTMVPIDEPDQRLDSEEDTRAELVGSPVYILDSERRTEITCERVVYHSLTDRFDLLAAEDGEVLLKDDRLIARGSHLWVSPENGRGGFVDRGSASVIDRDIAVAGLPDPALAPKIPSVVLAAANEPIALADEPGDEATPRTELDITWTGGVDLSFEPNSSSDQPVLQQIVFNGDVDVQSNDGVISCQQLKMAFDKNDQGKAVPARMTAVQDVIARNDDQTIWADDLDVTFAQATEQTDQPETGGSDSLIGADTRVQDVYAKGDVQVLLADGARAFADNLQADAAQETVELTGEDVVIARDDMLIDHGRQVTLRRKEGTAHWEGPGQARLLTKPLDLQSDTRIDRPQPPSRRKGDPPTVTMRARWNDAMDYDGKFNDGAGEIKLIGEVSVVAQPKPEERNQLNGKTLTLQFANTSEDAVESTPGSSPFDTSASSSRVLERLIAKGDAKLEQRTWATPLRDGEPRIFYVSAMHLTWNDLAESAEVIGDGELVIRDPVVADASDAEVGKGLFKGPGTSRFVWTRRLDMARDTEGGFDMSMEGDVEGLYKGATSEDVATITAERINARTVPAALAPSTASPADDGILDLGDDMDIDRLMAEGQVYIATPRRRVDCDLFDYDVGTGLAKVSAAEGRTVSIVTEGSPTPVRAGGVLWNMDPTIDTITITGARGGAINP
ncbi:MAG: hypothetical protein CMJ24_03495 [Phycisphaerae bacterium]|nr:hypothetical protein [Phycisphaerae bacterium]